jgi:hypothetical protein
VTDTLILDQLEIDAICLGILTANGIKPLSRLEYRVRPSIMAIVQRLEVILVPITRIAGNRRIVTHLIMGKDLSLIEQYRREFEGTPLSGEIAPVVRSEARYFGYPTCCAEAYIKVAYALNDLKPDEQSLLFHYACPGCQETPRLVPLYKSALLKAEQLLKQHLTYTSRI